MSLVDSVTKRTPSGWRVVASQLMRNPVRQSAHDWRVPLSAVAVIRLGGMLVLAIAAAGAQGAAGQQRLLVLPFEISAPGDSAVSHELAAIVQEQLAAALLGEVHVIDASRRAEAFEAARMAVDAILAPTTARQMAHFLRADLYVIGSLTASDTTMLVELRSSTDGASRLSAIVGCPFRDDTVRCGGMVVDSILLGAR